VHCRCYDCTLTNKPCATCALGAGLWGTGTPDPAACLSCVARRGQAFAGECNECAQSKAPTRCFSCLDTYDLKICASASAPIGSCRPRGASTPCARCANGARSGAALDRCLACFRTPARDGECGGCAELPGDAAGQVRCYECIDKAGFYSYRHFGCSQCYSAWVGEGLRGDCLACAESKSTPLPAKQHCATCMDGASWRADAKGRRECTKCLQAPPTHDYAGTCLYPAPYKAYRSGTRRLTGSSGGGGASWFARL
jgi:hypothetical protein